MILVNGNAQESHSVLDRGLAYGDGLFETIAVKDGQPLLLDLHWQRLQTGCERLKIPCPEKVSLMDDIELLLLQADHENKSRCVIKIMVTRGIGGRGYKFDSGLKATRFVILTAWPDYHGTENERGIKGRICNTRLSSQPLLAGVKHLNRLEQVMARSEWTDNDVIEGFMLDDKDNMIEGTMSNIFFVDHQGGIVTPSLSQCGVAGVQRENIIHIAKDEGFPVKITDVPASNLAKFSEAFITNSLIGLWPVTAIDHYTFNIGSATRTLQAKIRL